MQLIRNSDKFYSIYSGFAFKLNRGLLIDYNLEGDVPSKLEDLGFMVRVDFGIGFMPGNEFFRECEGINYNFAGASSEEVWSIEPWTEECLPEEVQEGHRLDQFSCRKYLAAQQLNIDRACAEALAEGVPNRIVQWARMHQAPSTRLTTFAGTSTGFAIFP